MRFPFPAIAVAIAGTVAAVPGLAQDAAPDAVARLQAMTCHDFLALDAGDQEAAKTAMLAHASGEPLPAAGGADAPPPPKPARTTSDEAAAPDGTEGATADEAGDRRLVALRTSCEGAPDALAMDALRAAFGDDL